MWRRVAPTLKKFDPEYDEKMAKITKALSNMSEQNPVFYEDEVDIDLTPKSARTGALRDSKNG